MGGETMECPRCAGVKKVLCHVNRGRGRNNWRWLECDACNGTGAIDAEHAARIAEGRRRADDRKARGLSLRDEARRLGVGPEELSRIEHGRLSLPPIN